MSRIWKTPVLIPSWVTVKIDNRLITVTWPKWELQYEHRPEITVTVDGDSIVLTRENEEKISKSLHGLTRTLVSNMVEWVTKWFEKKLQILWVWYSMKVEWSNINLSLGFSHPVKVEIWKWIAAEMGKEEKDVMTISWIDKQQVWEFAAQIRKLKVPEPYKWKWIRYLWEYVKRKAWKAAKK